MTEPKVLFIVGKGRSGSTLLDICLGELPGFFSLGEVWRWRLFRPLGEHRCGCGAQVADCPVWTGVLDRAAGLYRERAPRGAERPDPRRVVQWESEVARWWRVPSLLRRRPGKPRGWDALARLVRYAECLYRAAADVTGASVLVDSSKWPGNPGPLGLIPGIDPYVVHLVRDPRAVANSWTREKRWHEDGEAMPQYPVLHSGLSWSARNLLAEVVMRRLGSRALRVRYEDFADRPAGSLRRVAELTGADAEGGEPFTAPGEVCLGENHTAMGNAVRFRRGELQIRRDEAWEEELPGRLRALTTTVTFPLLGRYGYPMV